MAERRPRSQRPASSGEYRGREAPQGRLKFFFGASPGVGKTYAMLEAARSKSHLSRVFRRFTGLTPGAFRKGGNSPSRRTRVRPRLLLARLTARFGKGRRDAPPLVFGTTARATAHGDKSTRAGGPGIGLDRSGAMRAPKIIATYRGLMNLTAHRPSSVSSQWGPEVGHWGCGVARGLY
jgi:hypothetical protein